MYVALMLFFSFSLCKIVFSVSAVHLSWCVCVHNNNNTQGSEPAVWNVSDMIAFNIQLNNYYIHVHSGYTAKGAVSLAITCTCKQLWLCSAVTACTWCFMFLT